MFKRTPATWAAYWVLALYAGSLAVISTAMPFVRAELGLNYSATATYLSAVAVGILTAGAFGERLVRRLGRKKLFFSAAALEALALALIGLARLPFLVLAGAYLMGLGGALTQIIVQIILPEIHGERRSIAIAESNFAASLFTALTPLLIGVIKLLLHDWRPAPLLWAAVLGLWMAAFWRAAIPEGKARNLSRAVSAAAPPAPAKRLPAAFYAIMAATFLLVSAEWSIAFWTPDFLQRIAGFSVDQASTLLSVYFGAIVLSRLTGSILSRRFTDLKMLYAFLGIALAGLPVYWLAPWPWLRLLGLALTGYGIGNHYPMVFSFAMSNAGQATETASSRMTLMAGAAIFAAPLLLGGLADRIGIFKSLGLVEGMLLAALAGVVAAAMWRRKVV